MDHNPRRTECSQLNVIKLCLSAIRLHRLSQILPKQAKGLHDADSSGRAARNGTTSGSEATSIGLLIFCLTANVASADDPKAMLGAHNAYRSKHCVPTLTWSSQLAAAAQEWANGCKPDPKDPKNFSHSNVPGENLAWGRGLSATSAVGDLWYDEISKYNFAAPSWSTEVGHFTQVVWRNSAQIGCAMASCLGLNYWVCRYSPPGNWNVDTPGELAQNVPPPCIERVQKPPPGFSPGQPPPIQSVPKPPTGADMFKKMKP